MSKYGVTCTIIYNGYVEVEAESVEEALDYADNQLYGDNLNAFPDFAKAGDIHFQFGEATADYAGLI